ncbi:MAG: M20/M25/M40 family metallo-hydrolase [Thermocladium sp.]
MIADDKKIKALREALEIYSPTDHEDEMGKFMLDLLSSMGESPYRDDAGNVIAIRGSGPPVLWLHAHMDTVPGFIEVAMEGDKLIGRGASDDKAPLMAMAFAFLESSVVRGTLILTAVVQEEGDSGGTLFLINDKSLPHPSFIIIGEPTGIDRIVTKYRGSTRLRLEVRTRGGHASNPDFDSNAILIAMNAYRSLSARLGAGSRYEDYLATPTMINCGDAGNAIPSKCELVIDVRIPPGKSCKELMHALRELELGSGVRVSMGKCTEPVEVNVSNPASRAVARSIISVLGRRPILARKWGTSDMNELLALTSNMVAYGPGDGSFSHSGEEYININDYLNSIKVYKRTVEELLA